MKDEPVGLGPLRLSEDPIRRERLKARIRAQARHELARRAARDTPVRTLARWFRPVLAGSGLLFAHAVAAVLFFAVPRLEVPWTPLRAALVPTLIVTGTVIFAALWVLTAAIQFVMIDGHPATKAVTYGGGFLTQYPISLYGREFGRALTWMIPLAFVNWQPALYVFDRPDPLGLPPVFRFASPVVAALLCGVAALAWRTGLRHYRSTGS